MATGAGGGTGSSSASTGTGEGAAPPVPDGDVSVAWGVRWGAKATDERMGQILVDDDDSVVVAGSIGTFDAVEPALAAVDELDVLLARFDGEGQVLDARTIGGFGSDAPRALVRRPDGSLLVAGTFAEVLDEIDPPLIAFGGPTPFVAAFSSDLDSLWGIALLGAATGQGQLALAGLEDGGAGVAGSFHETMTIGERVLDATGPSDGFVARLGEDGSLSWVQQLGGPGVLHLEIGAAAALGDGLVVAVQLEGVLARGEVELARSEGQRRPVVVRFDRDGNIVAATLLGGRGDAGVPRLSARSGGLLLSVAHDGTFDLPDGELVSAGEGDAALLWTDDDGAPLFGARWGNERAQGIGSLLVEPGGGVLAGGSFQGAIDFGGGPHKAPDGRPDGFAVELTATGEPTRSLVVADGNVAEGDGTGNQVVSGVARFSNGDLAVGGTFSKSLRLGPLELEAKGDLDSFLVRVERW